MPHKIGSGAKYPGSQNYLSYLLGNFAMQNEEGTVVKGNGNQGTTRVGFHLMHSAVVQAERK